MTQIHKNLYVGNETDYEYKVKNQNGWNVIHACKEPYHREALGYSGRGAPKDHPEYLMAKRENRLILNLVDVENPAYIAKEIMDEARRGLLITAWRPIERCWFTATKGCAVHRELGCFILPGKE